jgi:non-ribosomal peptide synthetase component F
MTVFDTRREPSGAEILPSRRIHELFETLAALVPGTPAVIAEGESLTYGELDRRANRLARFLRSRSLGLGTEERVAVALERSPEAVVALLAVWKAGGAWLPLDLSWPAERLGLLLEESGATFLIAREESAAALAAAAPRWPLPGAGELPPLWQLRIVCLDRDAAEIAGQSAAPLRSAAGPEHLACILEPGPEDAAGVMLTHRDLVHRALAWLPGGRTGTGHRILQLAGSSAISLEEILLTLPQGAALCLSPAAQRPDEALGRVLDERAITHLLAPPDLARQLARRLAGRGAAGGQLPFEALALEIAPGRTCSLWREPAVRALAGLLRNSQDTGTDSRG